MREVIQAPARERSERDLHLDSAGMKAQAQRRQAEVVARYRAAHADATGSDKVIALLAELAAEFGREPGQRNTERAGGGGDAGVSPAVKKEGDAQSARFAESVVNPTEQPAPTCAAAFNVGRDGDAGHASPGPALETGYAEPAAGATP